MITIKHLNVIIEYYGFHVKNQSSLESAISSYDYYETFLEKCSSIFRGIIKNHPLHDGNKRLATFVLIYLLDCAGYKLSVSDIDFEKVVVNIASNNYSVETIAGMIEDYFDEK